MAFKMKGYTYPGTPMKKKTDGKQKGPVNDKQMPLQKGEMDGTYIYDGDSRQEKIIDYEDRAGFLTDNDITNDGSKEDNQRKKTAKNLNREADIIRAKPRKKTIPFKKKSPAKMCGCGKKKCNC